MVTISVDKCTRVETSTSAKPRFTSDVVRNRPQCGQHKFDHHPQLLLVDIGVSSSPITHCSLSSWINKHAQRLSPSKSPAASSRKVNSEHRNTTDNSAAPNPFQTHKINQDVESENRRAAG
jgi:hypothetical protein